MTSEMVRGQYEALRDAKRAQRPLWEQVAELQERARAGNRDAQRTLFMIRRSVERAERKIHRPRAA